MPTNINPLIIIFFYLVLSATLVAGPMRPESGDAKASPEQKAAERAAVQQRARTALGGVDSSNREEKRDGSATARIAEEPKSNVHLPPQADRNSDMNIQKTPVLISSNPEVAETKESSSREIDITSARFGSHDIYQTINPLTHEISTAAASRSPSQSSSRIAEISIKVDETSPSTAPGGELAVPHQQVKTPTTLKEKTEEAIQQNSIQLELMNIKTNEALQNGKPELANRYGAVVAKWEEATALFMQALQAEAQGKNDQGCSLYNAGVSTKEIAELQLKGIEAEESGKPELANRYGAVVAKWEEAAALFMQALQAKAQGKNGQGCYLHNAGFSTSSIAELQLKGIEAEESGKSELANRYGAVVAKQEEAAALFMQALQAETQGKNKQRLSLHSAGFSTSSIAELQLKGIEAEESGKPELANRYGAVVAKQEEAAALFMQALQAEAQGKNGQGCYQHNAGLSTRSIAELQLKGIEAEENGKSELANRYGAVVAKQEEAVALFMQGLQAKTQGKNDQGLYLNGAGLSTRLSADAEMKAIKAEESGKRELARLYRKVVAKAEKAVRILMQAVQAVAEKKPDQGISLNKEGLSAYKSAQDLMNDIEEES